MAKHVDTTSRPAKRSAALLPPVPMPPKTEEERRAGEDIRRRLIELAAALQQRNLDNALALAREAAAGRGELVEHFAELGRRFGHTLERRSPKKKQSPRLQVIEGGAS